MSSIKGGKKEPSAPFKQNIKFLFKGFDKDLNKCQGFKKSIRNLLVDNILKTMMFDVSSEDAKLVENFLIKNMINLAVEDENDELLRERFKKDNKKRISMRHVM
jgi:hypothetical protein